MMKTVNLNVCCLVCCRWFRCFQLHTTWALHRRSKRAGGPDHGKKYCTKISATLFILLLQTVNSCTSTMILQRRVLLCCSCEQSYYCLETVEASLRRVNCCYDGHGQFHECCLGLLHKPTTSETHDRTGMPTMIANEPGTLTGIHTTVVRTILAIST